MMSSLADMEIFARVVAAGSMSAAARDLGLSPAVVSKRLGRLEERLGTRLLQRTTRQIALTEAGQGYHERVLAILSNIEEAEAFVARRSADARGTLKISAPTTFGRMHIAPYLVPFMRANADLTVNMQLTDEMVDIVGDGYDLAIRIAELSDSTLVARRLAPVRRILVASPGYIAERGTPQTIEDLQDHICLAPHNNDPWPQRADRHPSGRALADQFQRNGKGGSARGPWYRAALNLGHRARTCGRKAGTGSARLCRFSQRSNSCRLSIETVSSSKGPAVHRLPCRSLWPRSLLGERDIPPRSSKKIDQLSFVG